jgi:hypothetical protein
MQVRRLKTAAMLFGFLVVGYQPAWGLTVTPGRTEARLMPGQDVDATIVATNDGKELLHVALSTKDWFVLEANKSKNLGVDSWLEIKGDKTFDLAPGASRNILIHIKAPKTAEGELVAMVSFLYVSRADAMVTPIISVSVYNEIAGTEKVNGQIEDITLMKWKDQLQAAVMVKSTGNVHLRPTGTLTIFDAHAKEVAKLMINEAGPAYPGRSQGYFAQLIPDFKLAPGRYRAVADLAYRELTMKAERSLNVSQDGAVVMDKK